MLGSTGEESGGSAIRSLGAIKLGGGVKYYNKSSFLLKNYFLCPAFVQRTTGFFAPLEPPLPGEVERVGEGRTTSSRQRWRLGQRPPRPRSSFTTTIVGLMLPPSSSVIAITISLLGCDTAMRSLAGEEGQPKDPTAAAPVAASAWWGGRRAQKHWVR